MPNALVTPGAQARKAMHTAKPLHGDDRALDRL